MDQYVKAPKISRLYLATHMTVSVDHHKLNFVISLNCLKHLRERIGIIVFGIKNTL